MPKLSLENKILAKVETTSEHFGLISPNAHIANQQKPPEK
jgi:hypothetical protein